MSNEEHWVTTRITEVSRHHPLVTETVLDRIGQLLNGPLSERQLRSAELKSVAGTLIADMVPIPPKAKAKQ